MPTNTYPNTSAFSSQFNQLALPAIKPSASDGIVKFILHSTYSTDSVYYNACIIIYIEYMHYITESAECVESVECDVNFIMPIYGQ